MGSVGVGGSYCWTVGQSQSREDLYSVNMVQVRLFDIVLFGIHLSLQFTAELAPAVHLTSIVHGLQSLKDPQRFS